MLLYTFCVGNNQLKQQVTISLFTDVFFQCCLLTDCAMYSIIVQCNVYTFHSCQSSAKTRALIKYYLKRAKAKAKQGKARQGKAQKVDNSLPDNPLELIFLG